MNNFFLLLITSLSYSYPHEHVNYSDSFFARFDSSIL